MPLKIGAKAPDFTLPSSSGEEFTLSKNYQGKPLILYFYPKDFSPVCTKEACMFRDAFEEFRDFDMDVVGVSRDTVKTHLEFIKKHELPYELLSDVQGQVTKEYKALMPLLGKPKRITYLLDHDHNIRAAYENLFSAKKHIETIIREMTDYEFANKR